MDRNEVLSRIEEIVRDDLDDDDIRLSETTRARDVDGWDSLAHIRIIVAIENAFDVQFSTLAVSDLANLGELITLIEQARNKK